MFVASTPIGDGETNVHLQWKVNELQDALNSAYEEIARLRSENEALRASSSGSAYHCRGPASNDTSWLSKGPCSTTSYGTHAGSEYFWPTEIRISSPLTWRSFYQKLDGYNEDWSWWYTWCPVCKRPLDVSVWQANREYTEPFPSKREFPRPQIVEEPEQRHGDDELYRLRNNLVVRRLGMDTSSEHSYEVVWPSEDAGRKIYLAHHGPSDPLNPLNHLGGWLGPCYDIVSRVIKIDDGQVCIPKPLKLKSRFADAVAL